MIKLLEHEDAGQNKNLTFISHLKHCISILDKQAADSENSIIVFKDEIQLMKEREEEDEKYRKFYESGRSPARKRTLSQFKPNFEDILKDLSSDDSGADVEKNNENSINTQQVERATGSSIDLTGDSIIVTIDTEEGDTNEDTDSNEDSTNTATSSISTDNTVAQAV
jgi:hypothetical protein